MNQTVFIPTWLIEPNTHQPRVHFADETIQELAQSIQEHGLIQPVVVRKIKENYEIIAGERRFRACKLLDMQHIPCILMETDETESAHLALVENIQRENLSAIEEAKAYVRILEETKITQSELAKKMGKTQSALANKIRLLNLPQHIQEKVSAKIITERHARALLKVDEDKLDKAVNTIIEKGYNVAQSEDYIKSLTEPKKEIKKPTTRGYSASIKIGMNTIQQAISMCQKSNIDVSYEVSESDDDVKMIISFKKEGA
ncbi:MAG: ParB/RepB/Spo0J family partition protein [Erysipelotrichaceae bacterium]